MRTLETTILNPSGIHARPGALFVRTAAGFGSKITLENLDRESPAVDAKSILSVMQAAVRKVLEEYPTRGPAVFYDHDQPWSRR